jgi:prepilin-type N-terminal cleavage/methylation domain-containing protein
MRRAAGFSLVEVLCAILILGIALVGLTQGIITALGSSKESELQTEAALMASGQIETLRAEGELIDGVTQGEGASGLSLYRWKQTISAAQINGLHEVDVVVENSKTGKGVYELRTLLFEAPSSLPDDNGGAGKKSDKARKRDRDR